MRRLLILALAISGLWGCNKKPEPAPEPDNAVPAAGETAGKPATELADGQKKDALPEQKPLTLDEYEAMMLKLAECTVDDRGVNRDCEAWKQFDRARKERGQSIRNQGDLLPSLGRKHLKHESLPVRLHATALLNRHANTDEESQKAILDALKTEKEPLVIRGMVRILGARIQKSPEVLKSLMALANHENEEVRIAVNDAFSSVWAAETEGTLEKVMEAVEKDPSPRVRELACKRLGNRADERALPLLEKMTASPGDTRESAKLYAACVNGLIAMWSAPVPPKNPSQKAYEMTMKILNQTPRNENTPPWNVMPNLGWVGRPGFADAAPWFKNDELQATLVRLVADRNAHWMARTGAVTTLKRLGASKQTFEQLAAGYQDVIMSPGVDKNVLTALNKAMLDEPLPPLHPHGPRGERDRDGRPPVRMLPPSPLAPPGAPTSDAPAKTAP